VNGFRRSIEVAASADTVLDFIIDVEGYPRWQKEVDSVTVHDTDDQGRPLSVTVRIKALGFSGFYTVAYSYPDDSTCEYHLTDGDMMSRHDARFTVVETRPGRTTFTVEMDLALRWPLPRPVVNRLARNGVNEVLDAVKRQAEQDGPARR
jgi:ribosome-associated toxin RatA of RatAB toxin-antitoxin module